MNLTIFSVVSKAYESSLSIYTLQHGGRKGWRGKHTQPRAYVTGFKIEKRWEGINRKRSYRPIAQHQADSQGRGRGLGGRRVSGGGGRKEAG